jgi:hypothetical protein
MTGVTYVPDEGDLIWTNFDPRWCFISFRGFSDLRHRVNLVGDLTIRNASLMLLGSKA